MTVTHARPCSRSSAAAPRSTPGLLVAFRFLLFSGLIVAAVWGGPVVRVAAIAAIPLALLVDWEGGVRHVLRMAALAVAIWLAPKYGGRLGDLASIHWGMSPAISNIAGIAVIGLLILFAGAMIARVASRSVRRGRIRGAFDHILGGLLGTAEAGLAIACGCWMLAAWAGPLESAQAHVTRSAAAANSIPPQGVYKAGEGTVAVVPPARIVPGSPRAPVDSQPGAATQQKFLADAQAVQQSILQALNNMGTVVRNDPAGQWLIKSNPLKELMPVRAAGVALEVAADPGALLAAVDRGQLDAITKLPELRRYTDAMERDAELRDAMQRQDFAAVLSHPLVKAMLSDGELHRALLDHLDELQRVLEANDAAGVRARAAAQVSRR